MRLLFDENLSFKLCEHFSDLCPGSNQVRMVGLAQADDRAVWDYAKTRGFTVVSYDSDFAELAGLLGPPPKVIWLRMGNQPTSVVAHALHRHWAAIAAFHRDRSAGCLEIY